MLQVKSSENFIVENVKFDISAGKEIRGALGVTTIDVCKIPNVVLTDCNFLCNENQFAIAAENWNLKSTSFEDGKCISLVIKGNSTIKGGILLNSSDNSHYGFTKILFENSTKLDNVFVIHECMPGQCKIKTPDGNMLANMKNIGFSTEKDSEGYFTYSNSKT